MAIKSAAIEPATSDGTEMLLLSMSNWVKPVRLCYCDRWVWLSQEWALASGYGSGWFDISSKHFVRCNVCYGWFCGAIILLSARSLVVSLSGLLDSTTVGCQFHFNRGHVLKLPFHNSSNMAETCVWAFLLSVLVHQLPTAGQTIIFGIKIIYFSTI